MASGGRAAEETAVDVHRIIEARLEIHAAAELGSSGRGDLVSHFTHLRY
jgi:hypothetical protein